MAHRHLDFFDDLRGHARELLESGATGDLSCGDQRRKSRLWETERRDRSRQPRSDKGGGPRLADGVVNRHGNDAAESTRDEQVDRSEREELGRRGELRADRHERERARETDTGDAGICTHCNAAARLDGRHAD